MITSDIKKVSRAFSFFSISVAWTGMNIFYSVFQALEHGVANDTQVIISWSAVYIFIAWLLFNAPLRAINHSYIIFKPEYFPIFAGIIGMLIYAILLGGGYMFFSPLGIITGFFFGISYSQLIHSERAVSLFTHRPFYRVFLYLSPVLLFVLFLILLPALAPKYCYRYMPDSIQHRIFARTISKFKVGDDFNDLECALPYYFSEHSDSQQPRSFSIGGGGPLLDYDMIVSNDTIVKLVIEDKRRK